MLLVECGVLWILSLVSAPSVTVPQMRSAAVSGFDSVAEVDGKVLDFLL